MAIPIYYPTKTVIEKSICVDYLSPMIIEQLLAKWKLTHKELYEVLDRHCILYRRK